MAIVCPLEEEGQLDGSDRAQLVDEAFGIGGMSAEARAYFWRQHPAGDLSLTVETKSRQQLTQQVEAPEWVGGVEGIRDFPRRQSRQLQVGMLCRGFCWSWPDT